MPRWPKIAVLARNDRSSLRPVVCERSEAMCAPRYSGGASCAVQRIMDCRSCGSLLSETQTRSVSSSTPRSTRAATRRARLDLEVRVRLAQLSQQAIERQGLLVHHRATSALAVAGLGEIAVVVPLDVVDPVLVEDREHLALHVLVRSRRGEVQNVLRARLDGQLVARGHDPFRMPPGEVAVEVDHLGLEPQPELHALRPHVVHERMQAVRPHVGRDDPVAEPGPVGAAVAEPAVVEHESLDADRRGLIGEGDELGGVVAEVDGLPDVERHRSLRGAIGAERAQMMVESVRDRVEPVAVRAVDPRASRTSRRCARTISPGSSTSPPPSTCSPV